MSELKRSYALRFDVPHDERDITLKTKPARTPSIFEQLPTGVREQVQQQSGDRLARERNERFRIEADYNSNLRYYRVRCKLSKLGSEKLSKLRSESKEIHRSNYTLLKLN